MQEKVVKAEARHEQAQKDLLDSHQHLRRANEQNARIERQLKAEQGKCHQLRTSMAELERRIDMIETRKR
jgi:hypothetical protein